MKRLVLLLLFGCVSFVYSQEISPYYPTKQEMAWKGYEPSQLTYYDEAYVQGALMNFIDKQLGMVSIDVTANAKKKSFTTIFQDRFSNGKLYVEYFYDKIDVDLPNPAIITSLKITGETERVIALFVRYWDTTYVEGSKKSVERNHLQDKVKLIFNNGKPYITVTNTTYSSAKEFSAKFKELLEAAKNNNLQE